MTKTQPRSTVIYARVSLDREGNSLAVDRQLDLCRKLAKEKGLHVVDEFVDNSISATSGKRRPRFEALLASRPESITVWHTDRLVRLTKELERVIELGCDVYAVQAGHLDLSNPAGKAVAITVTAWAQYEGEQKALRQKASNDQRAEAGLPYGCQRAFGYEPDGMTLREEEAVEIRRAAEAVIRGRSLSSLVQDLNQRGILTATGKTWRTTTLKAALLSPRNAGMRQHRGQVVGEAAWPAVLDPETAATVRTLLTDPARSQRGPSRRYLLSGAMTCGKCGAPVVGAFVKGKGETYRCNTLHLSRKSGPVDAYVLAAVIARLSQPDAVDLWAGPDNREQVQALHAEAESLRARKAALGEAFGMGEIDREVMAAGVRRITERLEVIESQAVVAVEDPTLREVATADDVAHAFLSLPQETQRALIARLLTVELLPVGSGHRTFDGEKALRLTWR
jgi:site-specific DNA recombinase